MGVNNQSIHDIVDDLRVEAMRLREQLATVNRERDKLLGLAVVQACKPMGNMSIDTEYWHVRKIEHTGDKEGRVDLEGPFKTRDAAAGALRRRWD